jgi:hypothetical protein
VPGVRQVPDYIVFTGIEDATSSDAGRLSERLGVGPASREEPMSASTRNVQGTLGLRQLGAALAAVAAAIVLIGALAVGQLATSTRSTGVAKTFTAASDPMAQANAIGKAGVAVSKSFTNPNGVGSGRKIRR